MARGKPLINAIRSVSQCQKKLPLLKDYDYLFIRRAHKRKPLIYAICSVSQGQKKLPFCKIMIISSLEELTKSPSMEVI